MNDACSAHQASYEPAPSPKSGYSSPLVDGRCPELPAPAAAAAEQVRRTKSPASIAARLRRRDA